MTGNRGGWWVATGLVLLSVIPVLGGALRLENLTADGEITGQNARFFASPVPVVVHIISATVYCLAGAFQFVPSLRQRSWHRRAGRVLAVAALLAALSGLWMTLTYPWPVGDGAALYVMRLLFGSLMAASVILGVRAIRRRDIGEHRAWMTRAYAIGVAAGTQAVVSTIWVIAVGPTSELERAALMGGSWALNLAVVQWRLYSTRSALSRPRRTLPASSRSGPVTRSNERGSL